MGKKLFCFIEFHSNVKCERGFFIRSTAFFCSHGCTAAQEKWISVIFFNLSLPLWVIIIIALKWAFWKSWEKKSFLTATNIFLNSAKPTFGCQLPDAHSYAYNEHGLALHSTHQLLNFARNPEASVIKTKSQKFITLCNFQLIVRDMRYQPLSFQVPEYKCFVFKLKLLRLLSIATIYQTTQGYWMLKR